MILGVDVSHWNTNIDYPRLYAGGVRFVICKISQGTRIQDSRAADHIEKARAAGMLVAGYHWADPTMSDTMQASFALQLAKGFGLRSVWVDAEQYWMFWNEFYNNNVIHRIPSTRIYDNTFSIRNNIRNAGIHSRVYTRGTFVAEYSPQMFSELRSDGNWYASYPYGIGRVSAEWEDFQEGGKWYPRYRPSLPEGVPCGIHQFSGDKFILPGTGGNPIDLNHWLGSVEELEDLFDGKMGDIPEPPIPEPIEEVELKLQVLRNVTIRREPATSAVSEGMRNIGNTVNILEMRVVSAVSVWVRDNLGWSAMIHNGVVYMREV